MATIEVSGGFRKRPVRHDLLGALRAGWQSFLRRREERRAMVAISRLDPHLIRDVGFDPAQVHKAVGGGWDAIDPVGLRMLLPKDAHI